ncbi:DUF7507 domain-containing protein [Shouchella xiaoxiensis]|uniref:DUF7507 domain-containing protein n=1 Tax=Shouchella xiaoxiensis TaxID=766895 RepID=UPI003462AFD9
MQRSTKSIYLKLFAVFLIVFSSILPHFSMSIASANELFEETILEDGTGAVRNEVSSREYDRARIDKRASSTGNPGEYFVDLTIEGKSAQYLETTDIVLVYDNSNSMLGNRARVSQEATTNFVNNMLESEANVSENFRMGLITYGTVVLDGRTNPVYNNIGTSNLSFKDLSPNASDFVGLLPRTVPSERSEGGSNGGTFTEQGLEEAGRILQNSNADNKVIITITDGVPTLSYDNGQIVGNGTNYLYNNNTRNHGEGTLRTANQLKEMYDLYTIAIELQAGQNATLEQARNLMIDLSSSPDQAYFADTVSELEAHLNEIARNLSASVVNGSITDPMGDMFNLKRLGEGFSPASDDQLTDGDYYLNANNDSLLTDVTVNTDGDQIRVEGLNLNEGDIVNLRYKVQLDTENEQFESNTYYNTNGTTTLQPRQSQPDDLYEFPMPAASAPSISLSGEKFWDDNGLTQFRPDEVTIELWRNASADEVFVNNQVVQSDSEGTWAYTFDDLILYDSSGNYVDYFVREAQLDGYEAVYDEDSYDMTNVLIENPSIGLEKEANRDDLVVGEDILYTFTIENSGNTVLNDVILVDELENISTIRYLTLNGEPINAEDAIILQPGDILVAEADYTITQDNLDQGQLFNEAIVRAESPSGEEVTDEDDVAVPQELIGNITLTKTSGVEQITEVGQEVVYTFDVENTGNVTLFNVEVDDPMLGESIELAETKLAPGEITTGTAIYIATQEDLDNGGVTNTAVATGDMPDGTPVEDEDQDELPSDQDPSITLTKEADRDDLVVGEEIEYTFTFENTGNVTLYNVVLTDELENISNIEYVSLNGEEIEEQDSLTLARGDVVVAKATYTITQADVDQGQVVNEATVTGTTVTDQVVTDEDSAVVFQDSAPGIELVKSSDIELITEVGQVIVYTFEIENTGNVTLDNVLVNDPMLDEVIELESTTLAPGDRTSGTLEYVITQTDMDNGGILNVATASGDTPGGPPVEGEDQDEVPATQIPAVQLIKDTDREDLIAGEVIDYTFTVENTGNVTLQGIALVDSLEGISEIRYVTLNGEEISEEETVVLAPGDILIAEATYTITQADVDRGEVFNEATVVGNTTSGEEVTDEDDVTVNQEPFGGIQLVKTSDREVIDEVGQAVVYTFEVENTGNMTLTNIELNDPMLGGAIELESTTLAPGESTIGTSVYIVSVDDMNTGGVTNVATVVGTAPDETPVEDEDSDELPADQVPEIELTKTANRDNLVAGEDIVYTFTVENIGNVSLTDVLITDELEDISDIQYFALNGEVFKVDGPITLEPGDVLEASATYTITQADVDRGEVVNVANVVGSSPSEEEVTDEDEVTVPQDPEPGINLVKSSDVDSINEVGTEITYTFEMENTGNVTLLDIKVNDPMLGGLIELEETKLAPGEKTIGTVVYTVTQQDVNNGTIINQASTEGTTPGGSVIIDDDEDEVPVEQSVSIDLEKEADRENLIVGEAITYTFTVENSGNVTLTDVVLTDELENISEIRYVTLNGDAIEEEEAITLEPGDILIAEATYTITQADVDRGDVFNEATVIGLSPSDEEVTDEDDATVNQEREPNLSLTKTSDREIAEEVGQEVTYTFVVENIGNVTLTGINVDDPMLGGAITLESTTLAPGETTTGTATYLVTQEDLNNGTILNIATATGDGPDGTPVESEDEDEIPTTQAPKIALIKGADRDDLVVGEDITYTFTAQNVGNVTLYDVSLSDELENLSEIEYVTLNGKALEDAESITLEPGSVLVAQATYTITQADVDRGYVFNEATVIGESQLDESVTDTDDVTVNEDPAGSIALTKTSNAETINQAGQEITYTFEVENTGNVTVTAIEVVDPMLGGAIELKTTTLAPGETTTGTAVYVVKQSDLNNRVLTNVAVTTGSTPDESSVKDTDDDEVPVVQDPKIELTKEADRENLIVGEAITYTFTVENSGNVTLTDVVLTDELENISEIRYVTLNGDAIEEEEAITLEPGDVLIAEATYTITQADVDRGDVFNEATVIGLSPSDEEVTDKDDATVNQEREPNLSLTKTSDREIAEEVGQEITYTFEVKNTGNVTLTNVVVDDPMLGEAITLEFTTLAPGETTTGTATYLVTQEDLNNGTILNIATATGDGPDGTPVESEDKDEIPSTQAPEIALIKGADRDDLVVGEDITYTFTAQNVGNVTLYDVSLSDELENLSEIDYLTVNNELLEGVDSITLERGSVLVAQATYTITQDDVDRGYVFNEATVIGESQLGENVTDTDDVTVNEDPAGSIALTKTSDRETISQAGDEVKYTFVVENTGNVTLTDVAVDDPMLGGAIELETTTLAPGETTTGTVVYVVTQSDTNQDGLANIASVIGHTPEGTVVKDYDEDWIPNEILHPTDPGKDPEEGGKKPDEGIKDIHYPKDPTPPKETGSKSPDGKDTLVQTANNLYAIALAGLLLLVSGMALLWISRKRKKNTV